MDLTEDIEKVVGIFFKGSLKGGNTWAQQQVPLFLACAGLGENGPHMLIYLNTWSQLVELGGIGL